MGMRSNTRQAKESRRCAWCGEVKEATKDHIFPRGIGGTLELSIPSCEECQGKIRLAETEVARRSIFALHRLENGPRPSDKRQPDSGAVETQFCLVKDNWLGGYREIVLR